MPAKKSAEVVNFFPIKSTVPAKKKGSTQAEKPIHGLVEYATVCSLIKTLETLAEGYKVDVTAQQRAEFITEGCAIGRRPANFKGVEGPARASMELRKRSDRSPLDEVQVEVCKAYGIETATVVEYSINPAYLGDEALLAKVSKALSKIPGLPGDLIVGKAKTVVTDKSVEQVFEQQTPVAECLIDTVGVLAVKPVLTEDFQVTLKRAYRLLEAAEDQKLATGQ